MAKRLAGGTGAALEAMDWLNHLGFGRFKMADIVYSMQQLTTREQIEVLWYNCHQRHKVFRRILMIL